MMTARQWKCIPVDSMSVAKSPTLPPYRGSRQSSRPSCWGHGILWRVQDPWSTVSYEKTKTNKIKLKHVNLTISFKTNTVVDVHLTNQSSIPDPGVDVPLNKVLGSKSIPRVFFTDLRFLFENPKEWPDSKGCFRLEVGVAITGVAEEKTSKITRD